MRRALLVVLACCLATAGVVSASALAGGSSAPPPTRAQALAHKRATQEERQNRIAARLGKTGQQLREARAAALRDVLGRLVARGRLTDAQRDAIIACRTAPLTCDRSNLPARPRRILKGMRRAMTRAIAKQLGVSVADLRAARRAERHHR